MPFPRVFQPTPLYALHTLLPRHKDIYLSPNYPLVFSSEISTLLLTPLKKNTFIDALLLSKVTLLWAVQASREALNILYFVFLEVWLLPTELHIPWGQGLCYIPFVSLATCLMLNKYWMSKWRNRFNPLFRDTHLIKELIKFMSDKKTKNYE